MRRTLLLGLTTGLAALASAMPASALRIPVEKVNGTICDFGPTQVLFVAANQLHVEDRGTKAVTDLPKVPARTNRCGYLSPHGAVFPVTGQQVSDGHLYESRDGSLIDLGFLNSQFKVTGRWLIW